jgi:hypothetical protein
VCSLSYEDPLGLWSEVFAPHTLAVTLSLGSATVAVELPVRSLPQDAPLFRDTDHAFRWFLAPFARVFLVNASLDMNPALSAGLARWVEVTSTAQSTDWLIVCVGDEGDTVFTRLARRYFHREPGDAVVVVAPQLTLLSPPRPAHTPADLQRLFQRLARCVASAFTTRR